MDSAQVLDLLVKIGIGAVLLEAIRAVLHRRQMKADPAKTITDAAMQLLQPLRARVTELEANLSATESRARDAATESNRLAHQLQESQTQAAYLGEQLHAAQHEVQQLREALAAALGHNPHDHSGQA